MIKKDPKCVKKKNLLNNIYTLCIKLFPIPNNFGATLDRSVTKDHVWGESELMFFPLHTIYKWPSPYVSLGQNCSPWRHFDPHVFSIHMWFLMHTQFGFEAPIFSKTKQTPEETDRLTDQTNSHTSSSLIDAPDLSPVVRASCEEEHFETSQKSCMTSHHTTEQRA